MKDELSPELRELIRIMARAIMRRQAGAPAPASTGGQPESTKPPSRKRPGRRRAARPKADGATAGSTVTPGAVVLTPEQLEELTGYVQPAAQIRWLRRNGIQHYVRADGHPSVPTSALDPREPRARVRVEPNFDAIRPRQPRRRR